MRAYYFAEMSEWFKEHDWKSCVGLKLTGGSNPLLCAKQKNTPDGGFFCFVVYEIPFRGISYINKRTPSGVLFLCFVTVAGCAAG